jgi:hypothetical protein
MTFAVATTAHYAAHDADPVILRVVAHATAGQASNLVPLLAIDRLGALGGLEEEMAHATDGASRVSPFAKTVAVKRVGAGKSDETGDGRVKALEAHGARWQLATLRCVNAFE